MARKKPVVTRTFAPIHFEDLDPHRFEDLVRELIYDFRDWQSIEAIRGNLSAQSGGVIFLIWIGGHIASFQFTQEGTRPTGVRSPVAVQIR